MVPALAVIAFPTLEYKQFGFDNVYVRQYALTGKSSLGVRPLRTNPDLQSIEAHLDPLTNEITARFIYPLNVTSNQTWFAIWARGPPISPTSPRRLSIHNEFYSKTIGVDEELPDPNDGGFDEPDTPSTDESSNPAPIERPTATADPMGSGPVPLPEPSRLPAEGEGGEEVGKGDSPIAAQCNFSINGDIIPFASCRNLNGGYRLYYTVLQNKVDIAVQSQVEQGYVAWGWGESRGITVPGRAAISYVDPSNIPRIAEYVLSSRSSSGVQPVRRSDKSYLSSMRAYYNQDSRVLTMRFTQELDEATDPARYNAMCVRRPNQRIIDPNDLPTHVQFFSSQLNLNQTLETETNSEPSGDSNSNIVVHSYDIAHAVLLSIAWILFAPMGALTPRVLKSKTKPWWFYLHVGIHTLVVVCTIIGAVLGLVYGSHQNLSHMVIGCVVLGIVSIQYFFLGWLRPNKKAGRIRQFWYHVHQWIGRIVIILAVTNVFLGMELLDAPVGWYTAVGVLFGLMMCVYGAACFGSRKR